MAIGLLYTKLLVNNVKKTIRSKTLINGFKDVEYVRFDRDLELDKGTLYLNLITNKGVKKIVYKYDTLSRGCYLTNKDVYVDKLLNLILK